MSSPESDPVPSRVSLTTAGDPELVRRMAAHEEAALAELYDRYAPVLLGLARRILGNVEDAEEVLQEVFVQAWAQAQSYDRRRSSPSTWLVLITRSRSIDLLRSRRVRTRTAEEAGKEEDLHTSPRGVGSVLESERRDRVVAALSGLPRAQREVLELAFYAGLTQGQIAEKTGIPLGTVKTRTLLAMRKLRVALQTEIRELL